MQQLPLEGGRPFPKLSLLFIFNALMTIGYGWLPIINMQLAIAFHEGGYYLRLPKWEIQRMEIIATTTVVFSVLAILDAIVWSRGKTYSGYLKVIFSVSQIGKLLYDYIPDFPYIVDAAEGFEYYFTLFIPIAIDLLVLWKFGSNFLRHRRLV